MTGNILKIKLYQGLMLFGSDPTLFFVAVKHLIEFRNVIGHPALPDHFFECYIRCGIFHMLTTLVVINKAGELYAIPGGKSDCIVRFAFRSEWSTRVAERMWADLHPGIDGRYPPENDTLGYQLVEVSPYKVLREDPRRAEVFLFAELSGCHGAAMYLLWAMGVM
jgi:hypothetical protein